MVLIHGQYPVDAVDSIVSAFEQDKEAARIAKVAAKKVDPLAGKMATPVRTGGVRSRQATPTRADMLPPQAPRIVSRSPSPHVPKVGVKMRDVKVRVRAHTCTLKWAGDITDTSTDNCGYTSIATTTGRQCT